MVDPILRLKAVTASYGGRVVLPDLSADFAERERVAILGHNGSGKSTLISCCIGSVPDAGGDVTFRGQPVRPGRIAENVSLGIGIARQGRNVFPSLSVEQNLIIAGLGRAGADRESVFEIFPILKSRRKQKAGTMSGGQQQMLAIAMSLMTEPGILLLDEPTVGLAPVIAAELFEALDRVANTYGLTILIVEQNVVPALKFADRAIVLKEGRLVYDGSSKPLLDHEHLISFY